MPQETEVPLAEVERRMPVLPELETDDVEEMSRENPDDHTSDK